MSESPSEGARLIAEMRQLRDRSGLSLAKLANESGYSKSAWQRYLSGKVLPPWPAVRALCLLTDASEQRLRVLWDLADYAWSGRAVVAAITSPAATEAPAGAEADAGPLQPEVRNRRTWIAWVLGFAVLGGAATAAIAMRPERTLSAANVDFRVGCTGRACDGQDPQNTFCGVEPQTLFEQVTSQGAGIEVRYNPLCKAVWARTWNTRLDETLTIEDGGSDSQTVHISRAGDLDQFVYTPLLGLSDENGHSLRVCLKDQRDNVDDCYAVKTPPG